MATAPRLIEPPFYDPPIADFASGQQHSQAWTEYHQAVADRLAAITDAGVTDGSEATPGDVGEYMATTGSAVGLVTNTATNLASLNLTPGDWDVSGSVVFAAGAGTHSYFGVGISGVDIVDFATYPAGAINQGMIANPRRMNITTATTVWIMAQAGFTGTMTAAGSISGRRAR
jgi:hypothetical protein